MSSVGISISFKFSVPKSMLIPDQIPSVSPSSLLKIAQSTISTLDSHGSSAARLKANAGLFGSTSAICQKIAEIWRAFCQGISSCFSRMYLYLQSFFITLYPEINQNMSMDALLKLYWGLGKENKWRECIDGRYHHLGKDVFDRGTHAGTVEPGFIASMEETFTFVEKQLNKKIDADWYLSLHKHTCAHFNGDPSAFLMGQEKVGVFRNSDDFISCTLANYYKVSLQAKAEFEALDQALKTEFGPSYGLGVMTYSDSSQQSCHLAYKAMSRDQIRRVFNKFLNEFYQEVESARTPDEKLMAIAKLQQRLEWLHPVRDGTARTSTALMNKFLTDYGFHPAILEYPHVSSSYTRAQWKAYLQNGLVKWEQERARRNPPV